MNRIVLATIAVVALVLGTEATANPDRLDRIVTGVHEPRASSVFDILNRPAQQISVESRFLIHDSALLTELGINPVITGATLLVAQPDGSTGVFRTLKDPAAGAIRIDSLFGQPRDVIDVNALQPIGLGYLYGDQMLIDVRMGGEAAAYEPTAIANDAGLSEKFRTEFAGISESGFGMPRLNIPGLPTQILITDGQTIVMGFEPGFREYREPTEIPLLSKIPVLGKLFAGRASQTESRALVVFLTPNIIDVDETE
jgi:hypothetical protein